MSSFMDKAKNFVGDKIADVPKPEASMSDVDLKDVAHDGVTYRATIDVKNPYSHSIPICAINYSLKRDGRLLLSGSMGDPGSIDGDKTTQLEVPLIVPHSVLVSLAKDIFSDWDIDYELDVGLIIDIPIIGDFKIPLHSKGEVKLPSLKDF
uniref:LEA n=1 Tax=Knorringia sibirica TaxID=328376 RepID=B8Y498_9CARY|nr:LEA [Knorringia sibirica]